MKLLFDENLSRRLVGRLADLFPESVHVIDLNLSQASDTEIWDQAKQDGYTIVTKDDDFESRSYLHGFPPKVIMIGLGNCTTTDVETLLRIREADIRAFADNDTASLLFLA